MSDLRDWFQTPPGQQALAWRGLQPIVQTYNFLSFLAHGLLALHLG